MDRIDSHQHFWKYDPVRDAWITEEMKAIQRDFSPGDLYPLLLENEIDGCVSVQADQSNQETTFLLSYAHQNPFVKGVVGWVDLKSSQLPGLLSEYSTNPKLKGFRHVVQAEPDGFLLQKDFLNGINVLQEFDFTYDVLVYSWQLEEVLTFVKKFQKQKFVIDHIAKPRVKDRQIEHWAKTMTSLSMIDNVYCKLSGMVTEAAWSTWAKSDFTPYLDLVMETFGPNRLMYGSDWPVCLVAATYGQQLKIVEDYIAGLSGSEKAQIMGGNAIRFYNL